MDSKLYPRTVLQKELGERTAAHPGYSLRAFARDLGVSPQNVSNILNGRRGISDRMAKQFAQKLSLGPLQSQIFLESARAMFARSPSLRLVAKENLRLLCRPSGLDTVNLEVTRFKVISNWYHFGLLELLNISKIKTTAFLAKRLGISENETRLALGRLENLKLIIKKQSNFFVNQDMVLADSPTSNDAVKKFHRQIILKALDAMEIQDEMKRYGSTSILPLRVKDVSKARAMIQEFRTNLAAEITDANEGEEIYGLSIQFFQLSQTPSPSKGTL